MPPAETTPPNVALRATLFLNEGVIKAFCTGYGCPTCRLGDGAEVVLAPSAPLRKEYYEVEASSCRDCTRPGGMYRVSHWGKRRVSVVNGETQVAHLVRVHRKSLLEINPDGSAPLSRPASPHTPPTSDPSTYPSGRQSTEPTSPFRLGVPLKKSSGRRRESEPLPTSPAPPKAAPLPPSSPLPKTPPRADPPRTRTASHPHPLHSYWSPEPTSITPPPRPSGPKPRPPLVGPSAPPSTPRSEPTARDVRHCFLLAPACRRAGIPKHRPSAAAPGTGERHGRPARR
ncbi:uncharacterized protein EHS24_001891 [Apiotrichum porosum]|uniref:Uncharacterized protein n=1 Tax=Apiotrichum porosum TaxID=105984 RepID=A0A427XJP2_9TREE|nr:uncharacterized protein EHS24_001891 [Apiotrichum porosum]RSH78967.1 hypothetical protein EHS24_001891 [Apiotrichum porosum]